MPAPTPTPSIYDQHYRLRERVVQLEHELAVARRELADVRSRLEDEQLENARLRADNAFLSSPTPF